MLCSGKFSDPLWRQVSLALDRLGIGFHLCLDDAFRIFGILQPALCAGVLSIGSTLGRSRFRVRQYRHRNHDIALGKPDATPDEIVAAAKAVGAHDFITALPDGYESDVNKRGGRVSAGQRQLISFARAFLADPAVLILDEATASLDIPSERLVQEGLTTLLADRTAIIIAHRLSTVSIADRVLVMEHGRIVEDGVPSDLIAGTGRFSKLHAAWRDSLV